MMRFALLFAFSVIDISDTTVNPGPHVFQAVDRNGDLVIRLDELQAYVRSYDDDKDQIISKKEHKDHIDKLDPFFYGHEDFFYNALDLDYDGVVTSKDLASSFKLADLNQNNEIDHGEFDKVFGRMLKMAGFA